MNVLRRLALIIILVLLAGAGATPALAGEYPVYACEAAHGNVNSSWIGATGGGGTIVEEDCPTARGPNPWQQGLVVRHIPGATAPRGAMARVTFKAPPGAGLSRITYSHRFCGGYGFNAGLINAAGTWLHYSAPLSCGTLVLSPNTLSLGGTPWVSLLAICVRDSCPGTVESSEFAAMQSVTVWVSDSTAPQLAITGGSATTPGWKRGPVDISYQAVDNTGIAYADVSTGVIVLDKRSSQCNQVLVVPCPNSSGGFAFDTRNLPNGAQTVYLRAQDAATNWATAAIPLNVDNTAPSAPLDLGLVGGSAWRQSNSFFLTWRNPSQAGNAPIAAANYAVCPTQTPSSDWTGCTFGARTASDVAALDGLTVPRAGEWAVRVWLRDAAGNESRDTAQAVTVRLDDTPPVVAFGPIDASDPTRIDIEASDGTSSVVRGEAEIRRRGDARWLPITTTRSSGGFAGRLDDEHLADGDYQFRALVADSAGNERSTTIDASGHAATRQVPARVNTRLVVGQMRRGAPRRSRGIIVHPTVGYGRTVVLSGRLTTPGANPVVDATIEVWEQALLPGAQSRRVAVVRTNQAGRFRFRSSRGTSRILRFRYPGTSIVRARTSQVTLAVRAKTTIRSSRARVVNGEDITLHGRVLGRPLPAVGKLVQLQAFSRGKWLTFATPRANPASGRWSYDYRFTATRGTVRYRFRALVPRESGFPYTSGASRYVYVTVRGL
jgi:protocatechuate 3,4-dioxygenase beta subunit